MSKGYLTEKQQEQVEKKVMRKMVKEGFMTKEGIIKVKLGCKPSEIKIGDLVITYEISEVKDTWEKGTREGQFQCAEVLPACEVDHDKCPDKGKWTKCGHTCIRDADMGQQGITKLVKVVK